jgi:pSer/pThr/pTyr-binding forkhead associated (FHA) protein
VKKSRRASERRRDRAQGEEGDDLDDDVDDQPDETQAKRGALLTEDAEVAFAREIRHGAPPSEAAPGPIEATVVRPPTDAPKLHGGALLVLEGAEAGTRIPLTVTPTLIGRLRSAEIVLADPTVSRSHIELVWSERDEKFRLRDLDSSSGTVVNGRVVEKDVVLAHGDVIGLGKTELRFLRAEEAPGPRPEPEPIPEPSAVSMQLPIEPREKTRTRSALLQREAPPIMSPAERRAAAKGCLSFVLGVLVIGAIGFGGYQWLFSERKPAHLRAQVQELLTEAREKLKVQDIQGAQQRAETALTLEPQNAEAQSIERMARTEAAARDALSLALRFADEENDAEAYVVLQRIPDASVFAEPRERLRASLVERQRARSRRQCEELIAQGKIPAALAAIAEHKAKYPDDAAIQALEQRAINHQTKPSLGNATASRARAAFAAGDIAGARTAAEESGAKAYVVELDRFTSAVRQGREAMAAKEGAQALPFLDEAFRLLVSLGGKPSSPQFADLQKPYANALYLAGTSELDGGDSCAGARHLLRALRVAPEDPKIQAKARDLDERAEEGLTAARSLRNDPPRARARATEALCFARTGSATYNDLKELSR